MYYYPISIQEEMEVKTNGPAFHSESGLDSGLFGVAQILFLLVLVS